MERARVLVVDDDRVDLMHMRKLLVKDGYEVVLAPDGAKALDILASASPFDVILLDRLMPGMSGIQVLKRIKHSERFRHIPVVFQTVVGGTAKVLEGLRAGAQYYLTKPLDARLVRVVVRTAIEDFASRRLDWVELERTKTLLGLMDKGQFRFQTLARCHDLAALLAKACPDPKRLVIGLTELMINALEHGNLGITYEEKSALIEVHGWTAEVERRQRLPENLLKFVRVSFLRTPTRIRFRIEDAGDGFNWREYLTPSPGRLFDNHGRGILLAKWEVFDSVTFKGAGNCVVADIRLS